MSAATPFLIGLTGRAGAGKDTAADVLCQAHQFYRFAFADPVRAEIVQAFGIDPALFLWPEKEQKTVALVIGRCDDGSFIRCMRDLGVDITAERTPREIMRLWGTEYRRNADPMYWTDRAACTMQSARGRGFSRIVITDVRFHNEAQTIRYHGGQIWRIDRAEANHRPADHASESSIADIVPDRIISNDRSVTSFARAVLQTYADVCAARC